LKKPGVRYHFTLQDNSRACATTIAVTFEQGV
jgi:hypothetical protein